MTFFNRKYLKFYRIQGQIYFQADKKTVSPETKKNQLTF